MTSRLFTAMAALLLSTICGHDGLATEFRMLDGHGGPIMGITALPDGTIATTGFDNAVGLWAGAAAPRWLDGHAAAVNDVVALGPARIASAGDDYAVIIWSRASATLLHRLEGHEGKVVALAASDDGTRIASAGWDGRIGLWDGATGTLVRWIDGHTGFVNDVVFGGDGHLISASADGTVREWRLSDGTQTRILARHGFGVNTLLLNRAAGWLAYGALDGGTRVVSLQTGGEVADLTLGRRPVLSMALRADGGEIAVGDGEGYIMVADTMDWTIRHDFRAARRGPVWALAYVDGGGALAAGGIEDAAYIWPLDQTGTSPRMAEVPRAFHTDPATVSNGERQFLRKCSVCHDLVADGGRKAGPTLRGVFGRPAGTVAGYRYSDALNDSDIIWSADTINDLFALGPDHYTPGSKMPMQQIAAQRDRDDLIAYLRSATSPAPSEE